MAEKNQRCTRPSACLAELTHRCPLQCPYCSNPLELDARASELDTETWKRVLREAAALGVLQVHLSGGEPVARRDLVELVARGGARGRPLHQSDHLGGRHHGRDAEAARGGGPRSRADFDPGQRAAERRPHRRLRRRLRPKREVAGAVRATGPPAHRQCRHASRQHRPRRRHGRAGRGARRQPGRDRPCAILRLGAEEPRRADADAPSRSSAPPPRSRSCGRATTARSSSTTWCRTITRGCRRPAWAAGAGGRST